MAAVVVWMLLLCGIPSSLAAEMPGSEESSVSQEDTLWITYKANGGRGSVPERQKVQTGEEVALPGAELSLSLGRESWRFVGWSQSVAAALPDYLPGDLLAVEEDVTLYAVYAPEICEVTYQVDGKRTVEEISVGETPSQVPELPADWMGWRDSSGRTVNPETVEIWGDQTFTAYETISLNTQDHSKYMDGAADGLFHPEQAMTRAEAAQVLYNRLAEQPEARVSFADVPEGMWYTQAVESLGALGVLEWQEGASFYPDQAITRGDFAVMVSSFLPETQELETFSDVPQDGPYYEAVGTAAAYGLFSGYPDGAFHPEASLSRAQAAVVFNQLLEREPDTGAIASAANLRIFPDVPPDHWAYNAIMEATVSHTYTTVLSHEVWSQVTTETTVLPDGYYRFDGWLYRVQNGVFLRGTTVDGFSFDAQGRYTTGSAALDAQLNEIVETYTNDAMTRDEKLRALYHYVRDNFSYLRRDLVSKDQTGWEAAYAEEFLRLGLGNCYSFSATFCLLSRELGLPAYTVVGGLGENNSPHGWVEIELDGTVYMFDPQLEWRYLHDYGRTGYDLFKVLPSQARFIYVR